MASCVVSIVSTKRDARLLSVASCVVSIANARSLSVASYVVSIVSTKRDARSLSVAFHPISATTPARTPTAYPIRDTLRFTLRRFLQVEHRYKSFRFDGATVSVHNPSFYSRRFQNFMAATVFARDNTPAAGTVEGKRIMQRGRSFRRRTLVTNADPSRSPPRRGLEVRFSVLSFDII